MIICVSVATDVSGNKDKDNDDKDSDRYLVSWSVLVVMMSDLHVLQESDDSTLGNRSRDRSRSSSGGSLNLKRTVGLYSGQ